ncbi:MAG: fibronectin type III domain-containing protein, partial [Acidobacteria bacterium]|nr:fibronectin type III domain-containing protein [Acidobacteriota bacterium]
MKIRYFALALPILFWTGCAPQPQPNSGRNVEVTWGLDRIGAAVQNRDNVVLPILKCDLEGFAEDVSEYRAWAVKRKDPGGRIIATAPSAGTYYPAFIFYDGAGDERIGIWIDGQEAGTALANADDNRQKLFYLSEPRTLKGGEKIELRALTAHGMYRTEDLLLLKQKPGRRDALYVISDVAVRPGENSAKVTWLTSWPAACTVETDSASVSEDTPFNNHRVQLTGLTTGREYRCRVVAQTREGKTVVTEWQTFRTQVPTEATGKAQRERVPLQLEGGQLPVTAGVPFAQGALGSDAHLRLLDAQGKELPLQTRVLARWSDGSVKWALLDFQSAQRDATLEYGAQVNRVKPESPLKVTEDGEAVAIDTGAVKFAVNKQRFGLLEGLAVEGDKIAGGGIFSLTGPDGTVYSSLAPPEEVAVEESGPVRASVRVRGRHHCPAGEKLFTYTLRVHAWAGQPYVRVQHTFGNDSAVSDFTAIKSLTLKLPLAKQGKQWSVANRTGALTPRTAVQLKQHRDDRFAVEPNITEGRRAAGWAEWSDGQHVVTLAVRDFWQNYPKDLTVKADGFELGLCPHLRPDEYDDSKGTIDEHRIYYYLHGGAYKLRQGVSKTHDFWVEAGRKSPAAVRAEQRVRMAAAPPGWYAQTKVFGELSIPKAAGILKQYDDSFARSFAGYLKSRETNRSYGMLNFGDWWGERQINWGNSEYDTQHAFTCRVPQIAQ